MDLVHRNSSSLGHSCSDTLDKKNETVNINPGSGRLPIALLIVFSLFSFLDEVYPRDYACCCYYHGPQKEFYYHEHSAQRV